MKKTLNIFFAIFLFNFAVSAQKTETIRVKGNEAAAFIAKSEYKFPTFTRAKIYLKNGEIASARINYDYFDQTMKYLGGKGDTLIISNIDDIKNISTDLDTFFCENKYYEWIASSTKARLAMRRTFKFLDSEKVGAYGTSSPTHNIQSQNAILGVTHLNLDLNEELSFSKETTYYISPINGHFVEANKKNISKLFPHKNISDYISEKKLNLTKVEDLVDVFVFANQP